MCMCYYLASKHTHHKHNSCSIIQVLHVNYKVITDIKYCVPSMYICSQPAVNLTHNYILEAYRGLANNCKHRVASQISTRGYNPH